MDPTALLFRGFNSPSPSRSTSFSRRSRSALPPGSPFSRRCIWRPAGRSIDVIFEFWLKIFGVAFGLGVVSGIVMAFQFGTNWSVLSKMSGTDPGAAAVLRDLHGLHAGGQLSSASSFLAGRACRRGSICFRPRWWRWERRFRRSGSWSTTAGCRCRSAMWWKMAPSSRTTGPRSSSTRWSGSRFPHMLLAAYLTGAFCVAATGAWYLLRREYHAEARIMLRMGLFLAAVLVPIQLLFGHLIGDYVHTYQPAKIRRDRGALARRAAGVRGAVRARPMRRPSATSYADQDARALRQHDRQHEPHLEGSRT